MCYIIISGLVFFYFRDKLNLNLIFRNETLKLRVNSFSEKNCNLFLIRVRSFCSNFLVFKSFKSSKTIYLKKKSIKRFNPWYFLFISLGLILYVPLKFKPINNWKKVIHSSAYLWKSFSLKTLGLEFFNFWIKNSTEVHTQRLIN